MTRNSRCRISVSPRSCCMEDAGGDHDACRCCLLLMITMQEMMVTIMLATTWMLGGVRRLSKVCLLVPGRAECSGAVVDGFRPRGVASSASEDMGSVPAANSFLDPLMILGLKLFLASSFTCCCHTRGLLWLWEPFCRRSECTLQDKMH